MLVMDINHPQQMSELNAYSESNSDSLFSVALQKQWCKYSEDCDSPLNVL